MLNSSSLKTLLCLFVMYLIAFGCLFWQPAKITPEPDDQIAEKVPAGVVYEGERSSGWSKVRSAYVRKHPTCEACGTLKDLNVHHVKPFHLRPELELDPGNLITLCREHHFYIGHRGNWSKENPNCRQDAANLLKSKALSGR